MSTELTTITIPNPLQVFSTPNGLDSIIDKIEAEAKRIDRDISTESGRDNIRSLAFKLAKSKTFLDKMGKDLTEEQRAQIAGVNAERKRAWERMEALQEEIRKPLTEWENKDKLRVAEHEAALTLIVEARNAPFPGTSPSLIKERMDNLPALMNREWEEFSMKAIQEADATRLHLQAKYDAAVKAEKDAAELARFRAAEEQRMQQERDAKIAEDARLQAERKAAQAAEEERQRVETARQEAAAKAQKAIDDAAAALAAVEKKAADDAAAAAKELKNAQERAEREKAAALKKQQDDAAAAQKALDDAAAKRAADTAHKATINNAAAEKLNQMFKIPISDAKAIVIALAKGEIPNVTIKY